MNFDQTYTPGMKRLIALFPQREISSATIAAYWELLSDLDDAAFERAVVNCGRACTFFPTVRELRDAAGETAADREHARYLAKLHREKALYEGRHPKELQA